MKYWILYNFGKTGFYRDSIKLVSCHKILYFSMHFNIYLFSPCFHFQLLTVNCEVNNIRLISDVTDIMQASVNKIQLIQDILRVIQKPHKLTVHNNTHISAPLFPPLQSLECWTYQETGWSQIFLSTVCWPSSLDSVKMDANLKPVQQKSCIDSPY